jgi:PAS domain S-box-containing protein
LARHTSFFADGDDSRNNFTEPFKYIVDNSNQGILVVIGDKAVYFNKKIVSYTGYSPQEIFSRSVTDFIHPDDQETISRKYIWHRQVTHPKQATSFRVITNNGSMHWVELHTAEILWNNRNATLCFLSDVTDHKKFERELSSYRTNLEEIIHKRTIELQDASKQVSLEISKREKTESVFHENNDTFRKILNSIKEGFFETNLSGKLLFYNKALCDITGMPQEELTGCSYKRLTSEKTARSLKKAFKTIYSSGKACKLKEVEIIRKDQTTEHVTLSV